MTLAVAAVERRARVSTIAAMAGAIMLDLDKPSLHFFGLHPFSQVVRRIHSWAQNESPNGMRNELLYGPPFALADALSVTQRSSLGSGYLGSDRVGPVFDVVHSKGPSGRTHQALLG
jgi:hypothetical protein